MARLSAKKRFWRSKLSKRLNFLCSILLEMDTLDPPLGTETKRSGQHCSIAGIEQMLTLRDVELISRIATSRAATSPTEMC